MRKVVLPIESSRSSGRQLLRGVAQYSRLHGPWTFFWEPGGLDEIISRLKNLDADGIIMRDSDRLEEILSYGFPVVVIGHHYEMIPGLVNIISDSNAIGRMAAEHLLNCGFKHFAYIGLDDKPWSQDRCKSFQERVALAGSKAKVFKQPYFPKAISWEKEHKYVVEWLKQLPKPAGLMACNDDRSRQALQACKTANLNVPEDVAIIGVDNDELICDLADTPLTSVSVNFERGGYEGAAALERLICGEQVSNKVIVAHATHIVTRQSTDITAIDDDNVADAIRFIRNNAIRNLSVEDVVGAVALSRRVLEKRFRDYLSRSILQEIRRVRVNLISQMLIDTNFTISQIAMELGFNGDEHIARYFRREEKVSPLQFRKIHGRK